jgi:uncharacterized protein YhbP (UPF0306 family)
MKHRLGPLSEELLQRVLDLLNSQSTLTLSVADGAGRAHAAPVFYITSRAPAPAELDLLWLSSNSSLHSVRLAVDPQAAVSIHRPTFAWREIAGVQMHGLCSTVTGPERQAALQRYCERFQLGTVLGLAIRQSTLYRFHPTWVRLTDNRESFGWKAEFAIEG